MRAVIVGIVVHVTVFLMFGFLLASDHHPAGAVEETTQISGVVLSLVVWSASPYKYLLHLIKQLLCHYWLVLAYVHFPQISEVPVVERIFQNGGHSVDVDSFASVAD